MAVAIRLLTFLVLFLLIGIAYTILKDRHIRLSHRKTLLMIMGLCVSLFLQNHIEYVLMIGPLRRLERTLVSIYGYAVRPVIIVLTYSIIAPQKRFLPAWALVCVNAAVYLTALFSPVCFTITVNNHFLGGPLKHCCLVVSLVLLLYLLYLTVHEHRRVSLSETVMPVLSIVMILASIWADARTPEGALPIAYLTVAMAVSCVFYYIWLHLQFVCEHEEDMKAQQRIQIMMSQIQPHFLYNTLSTIQVLCHKNPEKAAEITEDFGAYLRQNLSSITETGLIPLWKELKHTETYVEIEKARFPKIQVNYDIQDNDFSLPPLTLQPLVENAIRHGVRIRAKGIIDVIARKKEGFHEILIRDNGKGFDVQTLEDAGESHIGIRNVRDRVERLCGGTVTIDSQINEGTLVTIRLPVHEKKKEGKA